jgi:hypothetical protein
MTGSVLSLPLLLVALAAEPHTADLPSPDAMWLGARVVPRGLVDGFRGAIVDAALDAALTGQDRADRADLRARALKAMAPALDEAFPPEVLAGLGASFLARHYTAEEIQALRAREESAIGEKLRAFERSAAEVKGDTQEERERAREALSRRTFTAKERAEIEAFAASPLGQKGLALAPDLAGHFVDQLDRRWAAVRGVVEPRLRKIAEELVARKK